jgi:hypothetical protein
MGIANGILWPDRFEAQRRTVMSASMVGMKGRVQKRAKSPTSSATGSLIMATCCTGWAKCPSRIAPAAAMPASIRDRPTAATRAGVRTRAVATGHRTPTGWIPRTPCGSDRATSTEPWRSCHGISASSPRFRSISCAAVSLAARMRASTGSRFDWRCAACCRIAGALAARAVLGCSGAGERHRPSAGRHRGVQQHCQATPESWMVRGRANSVRSMLWPRMIVQRTAFRYRELRPLLTFSEELWFSPAHEYRCMTLRLRSQPVCRPRVSATLTASPRDRLRSLSIRQTRCWTTLRNSECFVKERSSPDASRNENSHREAFGIWPLVVGTGHTQKKAAIVRILKARLKLQVA